MMPKDKMISLSEYLEKPSCDFQRSDLLKVIKEKELERITFRYIGLDGRLKELKFPISNVLVTRMGTAPLPISTMATTMPAL